MRETERIIQYVEGLGTTIALCVCVCVCFTNACSVYVYLNTAKVQVGNCVHSYLKWEEKKENDLYCVLNKRY